MYKYHVDSWSTINPLLETITAGISYLMASFGNNIAIFNKETCSIGTDLHAHGYKTGKILLQLFATYDDRSSDNGPFTRYIETLENHYNDGTINLKWKDIMDKEKVKYNKLKDKIKFNGSYKAEDPIL